MKAVVFKAAFDVAVETVADPRIEQAADAVIRITTANICGSDLHPYEGRAPLDAGMVLGHENMGVVEEIGSGVDRISVGDRVSVPFNIACGTCRNCVAGWTCACLRANPSGRPTAGYGYPMMGPYRGGQAEYLRVPWADFNLLKLPAGTEHENDFTMLSDIFPTGYHGTELAGVSPGNTVAVFGAGPVGLMAAHSAALRGAAQVFVVDKAADRLALAEQYGATAVNFADADPVQVITDATDGAGVDCGIEAVGYQAHDASGQEHPEMVLDELVEDVRATGRIGVVGVYNPQDPGAATEDAQQGRYGFNYGLVFDKAISMGHGQCPVKRYNHQLRDLIIRGKARPSLIVSHEPPLDQAPMPTRTSTSGPTGGPRSCSGPDAKPGEAPGLTGAKTQPFGHKVLQVHRGPCVPGRPADVRGLVLVLRCRRVPAAFRHRRIAVRRDTPPAADVLAALDEPAQRVPLGMFLLRAPVRARD